VSFARHVFKFLPARSDSLGSGQISGFFSMDDFGRRFGEFDKSSGSYTFSAARQGTITGLLQVGCLFGALIAGKMADVIGRRLAISVSSLFTCIGIIIEISSETVWAQFAVGRFVNGIGIGALSVVVPMYQGESSPAILRGLLISTYQLFITLGIWLSNMVDYGTHNMAGSASWRIPDGLGFAWALILGAGILFLPESPRYAYRKGREEEARNTIASLAGLNPNSRSVNYQITEIRVKLEEEKAGADTSVFELFTAPRMAYRTILGMALQVSIERIVYGSLLPCRILTCMHNRLDSSSLAPTSSSTTERPSSKPLASATAT
jgi:MFS transporter, SP family, sugar:H+ symporter